MTRYYKSRATGAVHSFPVDPRARYTPVLVIDPDDREAVERLHDALLGDYANLFTPIATADAIRSLLDPEPDEPKGLGAVVKDREGLVWVRVNGHLGTWRRARGLGAAHRWSDWTDLDIPDEDHILSPGVEVE